MIEKEGKLQVEITGAWWEDATIDNEDVSIAKLTIQDSEGNEDELALFMTDSIQQFGKYENQPQFIANLERLTEWGMTDGDPANIEDVKDTTITVFGKFKEKDGKSYYTFYPQDGAKIIEASTVADRIAKLRGRTAGMGGTPIEKADDTPDFP